MKPEKKKKQNSIYIKMKPLCLWDQLYVNLVPWDKGKSAASRMHVGETPVTEAWFVHVLHKQFVL